MTLLPVPSLLAVAGSAAGLLAAGGLSSESYALTGTDLALQRALEALTLTWVCGLGAVIGSFLNVVIYRLPRGMSLNHPKSNCPGCQAPIARRDNLPILGWLLLRGRCRACQMPIPARYPLVELGVAGIALALLLGELLTGGANLPVRIPNRTHGNPTLWILWYTKWDIVGITLYHASLLTVLLATWLIARDGFGPPWKLAAPALWLALLAPVVWPELHPLPYRTPRPDWLAAYRWEMEWSDQIFSPGWPLRIGVGLAGLLDGLAGAVAGVLLGRAAGCGIRSKHVRSQLLSGWALLGTVLGWQASLSAAVLAGVLLVAVGLVGRLACMQRSDTTPLLGLWIAAGVQILLWNVWDGLPLGIGHAGAFGLRQGWVAAFAAAAAGLALGAAATRPREPVEFCK